MPKRSPPTALIPPLKSRRTRPLGPFSYLLMATLAKLPKEHCYGAVLERVLSDQYGELIDLAQVYVTLVRLRERGLLSDKQQLAPTGTQHTVTVYAVTPAGREALAHAASFYKMLAEAAPA